MDQAKTADLQAAADQLLSSRREFLQLILIDATKEFDEQAQVGFGLGPDTAAADFQAVRGDYDSNEFVASLRREIQQLEQRIERFHQQVPQLV